MLALYRDEAPGAYVPEMSGILPTIVDLKLPVISRRDMKLLLRYPEPRRTANWIRLSFVACDECIASSGVLYRAYLGALLPLIVPQSEEPPQKTPSTPLLSPDKFSALLEKQIKGYEPYSANGKNGRESRVITRGARARIEALTFPSTNRKRNLRQLRYYKKKGDLIYPEGDPNKRSTYSKWLAHDPLFMLPKETQSPLVTRMIAGSARPNGATYYDGQGTEDAGFPGVSIEKRSNRGKGKSTGRTRGRQQAASANEATLLSQTLTHLVAAVQVDPMSVGGFGSIVRDATEQLNKQMMDKQRELDSLRDEVATEKRIVKDTRERLDQQVMDNQRELVKMKAKVAVAERKANAIVESAVTRAVGKSDLAENVGSVKENTKPTGSFEAVLGIRQAASKRLGNRKRAMVANLTHLGTCSQDHTSDTTKYDHPHGAIGFIEQVEKLTAVVAYRRMHELYKTRNTRFKLKQANTSKVIDAASTAPVCPAFMELALRPRRA